MVCYMLTNFVVEYELSKNIKNTKQSQFENRHNVYNYCINKRLQPNGHLVSWEKQSQFKAKRTQFLWTKPQ